MGGIKEEQRRKKGRRRVEVGCKRGGKVYQPGRNLMVFEEKPGGSGLKDALICPV